MANKWLQRVLLPAVGLALLGASVWFLFRELHEINLRKVFTDISQFSIVHILITLALVTGGYLVTLGYDFLALRFVRKTPDLKPNVKNTTDKINISRKKIALAGFISCAFSNSVSLPLINVSGTRFRFYGQWGLSAKQIVYMVCFIGLSTWMGLLLITGIICVINPPDLSATSQIPETVMRCFAALFIAMVVVSVVVCTIKHQLRLGKWHIDLPSKRLLIGQLTVGSGDWIFQAAVFYMVLNISDLPLQVFLPSYFAAMFLAMLAHLPAGLGVFDAGIIGLLSPVVGVDKLVAGLLLYRVFYHVLPLLVATLLFGGYELYWRTRRKQPQKHVAY